MTPTASQDDVRGGVTALRRKDLLGIAELGADEISLILDTAEAMKEVAARPIKKVPTLRGKTVVMLVNDPGFHVNDDALFAGKKMTYYGRHRHFGRHRK